APGLQGLPLAAVSHELDPLIGAQEILGAGRGGPPDPMIDRGSVPGLHDGLGFQSRISDWIERVAGLDLEGVERAGLGCDLLLGPDFRSSNPFPREALLAVGLLDPEVPGCSNFQWLDKTEPAVRGVLHGVRTLHVPGTVEDVETGFALFVRIAHTN